MQLICAQYTQIDVWLKTQRTFKHVCTPQNRHCKVIKVDQTNPCQIIWIYLLRYLSPRKYVYTLTRTIQLLHYAAIIYIQKETPKIEVVLYS